MVFISEMSQKEHLARQKQLLNKTLGLDAGIGLGNVGDELFREEDLIVESSSVHESLPQVFLNTQCYCTALFLCIFFRFFDTVGWATGRATVKKSRLINSLEAFGETCPNVE